MIKPGIMTKKVVVHKGEMVRTTLGLMVVVEEANAKGVGMTLLTRLTLLIVVMMTMLVVVVMGMGGAEVEARTGVAVVQAGIPQLAWIELLTSFVRDLRI